MSKQPKPLPEHGTETPAELYTLVGVALSWWEASEDETLGLFRELCAVTEPVALETFIHAGRHVRASMLRLAMSTYPHLVEEAERLAVEAALKALDKLASKRNEIAHGYVGSVEETVDERVIVSGNYLLPSRNEQGPFERGYRFHYTAQSITDLIQAVRAERAQIMEIRMAVMQRLQRRSNFGCDAQAFMATVRKAARLELSGYEAVEELKRVIGFVEQGRAEPMPPAPPGNQNK